MVDESRAQGSQKPAGRRGAVRLERRVRALENTTSKLAARVEELEAELLDARAQGRRAAEIADVVTALLSNEASRRDPKFVEIVERFISGG